MGFHDHALPKVSGLLARQGASASRRGVPAWSRALRSSGGQLCMSVYVPIHTRYTCTAWHVCFGPFLCATTCRLAAPAPGPPALGRGGGEVEGCRSSSDRGATPPCRRGRKAARPSPQAPREPVHRRGGRPHRRARRPPLPPLSLTMQPPLCRLQRRGGRGGAQRPRRSAVPTRRRAARPPRHPPPFRLPDGAPRRGWARRAGYRLFKRRATPGDGAGRARPPLPPGLPHVVRVPVPPGRRRSWAHTARGCRRGSPGLPAPAAAPRAAGPARPGLRPCASAARSGRPAGLHRRRLPRQRRETAGGWSGRGGPRRAPCPCWGCCC